MGRQLRRLREESKKTWPEIEAAKVGVRQTIWRIEKAQTRQLPATVRELCRIYGASAEQTEALADLAMRGLAEQALFEDFSDVVPTWFGTYAELEGIANSIAMYDTTLVPGLLQTPAYARAIFEAAVPRMSAERIERLITSRIQRQKFWFGDESRGGKVTSVLEEGALARRVGGDQAMEQQIDHLRTLHQTDQAEIKVLMHASGAHAAMESSFILLGFDDPDEPDFAYVESRVGALYHEKESAFKDYEEVFRSISQQAIPIEEYAP